MDVLPMCSIFQELQIVHDTGYFSALPSLEEYWQQVNISTINYSKCLRFVWRSGTGHASFTHSFVRKVRSRSYEKNEIKNTVRSP